MTYTDGVVRLTADPFGGRTAEEIRRMCAGAIAQHALAHQAEPAMLIKFAKDNDVRPERAAELFEQTKRYLVIGRLVGAELAPSPAVDALWHTWILFTYDYHVFCEKVGGYIHHKPLPPGSPEQPPLEPTIELLRAGFGQIDVLAWPIELGAGGIMDCKQGG